MAKKQTQQQRKPPPTRIIIDPEIKKVVNYTTEVVATFGRFQPPTVGHQRLVETIQDTAGKVDAMPVIGLSMTESSSRNPVPIDLKLRACHEAFGGCVCDGGFESLFEFLIVLGESFDTLTLVLGEDQVDGMSSLVSKYQGNLWEFDRVDVIGLERNLTEEIGGTSGTVVRNMALYEDRAGFYSHLADGISEETATALYAAVRGERSGFGDFVNEAFRAGKVRRVGSETTAVKSLVARVRRNGEVPKRDWKNLAKKTGAGGSQAEFSKHLEAFLGRELRDLLGLIV